MATTAKSGARAAPEASEARRGQRRTQAERSASTRRAVVDAAIRCLYERGYGTTTTMLVAAEAGVSRGGMLHQFPTKHDLMAYVVEAVFEEEVRLYGEQLQGIDDPGERLLAYPTAVWKMMSRPAGVAVLEILQGSRSDKALADKLANAYDRIEAEAHQRLEQEFPGGISMPLYQLIVAVGRGLSINQLIGNGKDGVGEAIELFRQLLKAGAEKHIFVPDAPRKPRD